MQRTELAAAESTSLTASVTASGGYAQPQNRVAVAVFGISMVGIVSAIALDSPTIAAACLVLSTSVASFRVVQSWPLLVAGLMLVVFLIPIKRYKLPIDLPFDLEPYRLFVMALALIWVTALLCDPRVRLRRTIFDVPLLAMMFAVLASAATQVDFIEQIGVTTDVIKSVTFFISFLVVYFMIATVVVDRSDLERLVRLIVTLASFVAVCAIIEYRTKFNLFDHLSTVIPVLDYQGDLSIPRDGRFRALGSAQHPIALAAVLAMVFPLGLYLAQTTRRWWWWLASFALGLGALSTLSRTGVVATLAGGIALLCLRPSEARRLIRFVVPALVIIHLVLPNALGSFKSSFFPHGGIVAQQSELNGSNQLYGNGRLSDIGPTLGEWSTRPFFGRGYGSRIVVIGPRQNAAILDDQWLGFLLDAGLMGFLALAWTVTRGVRRLGTIARGDPSDLGLLAGALAAAIVSYSVGMLTYDAFDFIQVTLVFFVILAFGATVVRLGQPSSSARRLRVEAGALVRGGQW